MKDIFKEIERVSCEEFKALDEFKSQGGKIAAVFCRKFPASLLSGLGLWPLRVLSGATGHAESVGERIVRPDVCPYCKSIIGNFLEKSSIHKHVAWFCVRKPYRHEYHYVILHVKDIFIAVL